MKNMALALLCMMAYTKWSFFSLKNMALGTFVHDGLYKMELFLLEIKLLPFFFFLEIQVEKLTSFSYDFFSNLTRIFSLNW